MHLDTSLLIRASGHSAAEGRQLHRYLSQGEPLSICAVAWAEFHCGPVPSAADALVRNWISAIVPVDAQTAERGAEIFNSTGRRRGSLADCLIAACAIEADEPLATSNTADFVRFRAHGLRLAD